MIKIEDGIYFLAPEGGAWICAEYRGGKCTGAAYEADQDTHRTAGDRWAGVYPETSDDLVDDAEVAAAIILHVMDDRTLPECVVVTSRPYRPWTLHMSDGCSVDDMEWEERPSPDEIETACREWAEGGDWGDDGARVCVDWALYDTLGGHADQGSHTVDIAAEEPACADGHEHEWTSPHDIVGGLEENPGVFGHGGGVCIHVVCAHCGLHRHTDTWADDGRGGHCEAVTYEAVEDAGDE